MTSESAPRKGGLLRAHSGDAAAAWQPQALSGSAKGAPRRIAKELRLESEYLGSVESSAVIPAEAGSAAARWTPQPALATAPVRPLVPMAGRVGALSAVGTAAEDRQEPLPPKRLLKTAKTSAWAPADIAARAAEAHAVSRTLFHSPELARQAQEELHRAREEADRILREAREQAEAVTQQAKADGRSAAEDETRAALAAAAAVLAETKHWREEMLAQSEQTVLELVREIAKAMFGQGVALDPAALRKVFERAMAEARAIGDLRIHVHPEDAMALGSEWWQQEQASLGGQRIELVASESVRRGGCYIEGELGSVDARVESQMQTVLHALGGEDA